MKYYEKLELAASLFEKIVEKPEIIVFGENMIPMFDMPPGVGQEVYKKEWDHVELCFKIMPMSVKKLFKPTWRSAMQRRYEVGKCVFYLAAGWSANIIRGVISTRMINVPMYGLNSTLALSYSELVNDAGLNPLVVESLKVLLVGSMRINVHRFAGSTYQLKKFNSEDIAWLLANRYIDVQDVRLSLLKTIGGKTLGELDFGLSEFQTMLGATVGSVKQNVTKLTINDVLEMRMQLKREALKALESVADGVDVEK